MACAVGPSSVSETSIRASYPAGVIASSRSRAPPVSSIVGLPRGQVDDAHVAPEHAAAKAGAERLGAGLLGGEALGVGLRRGSRAGRPCALRVREDAVEKSLAVAVQHLSRCAGVADVGAETDDHAGASRTAALHRGAHQLDGLIQPFEDRPRRRGNVRCSIRPLAAGRYRLSARIVQSMARVHLKTDTLRELRAGFELLPFRYSLRRVGPRSTRRTMRPCAIRSPARPARPPSRSARDAAAMNSDTRMPACFRSSDTGFNCSR